MNDEEKLAYYIRMADQSGKRAADLDRQLQATWEHVNELGEMLRVNGLDAGLLTGHIDSLEAIRVCATMWVDAYEKYRVGIVHDFHEAEQGIEKGRSKEEAFDWIAKRFRVRNRAVMDAAPMAEARRVVAEGRVVREQVLGQVSLFDVEAV
ncbi:hypothetical protein [Rhodococcoides fascians]|uniref:hypothetical protein n=1 Tax=Rhodococcoides fascians TaxID=1828 RepID=UPI00050C4D1E|nr:hypothetical protein [Rhodococcus fascians]